MPVRVKNKPPQRREFSPASGGGGGAGGGVSYEWELPAVGPEDEFKDVVEKLSIYFGEVIELPSSFEQLRSTSAGDCLKLLVDHLGRTCTNPVIVSALL